MTRTGASRAIAALLVGGAIFAANVAEATGPDPKPAAGAPSILVSAMPVFGADAATGNGWFEIVARVENIGTSSQKGSVELASAPSYLSSESEMNARAPFNVPAGRVAIVKLPMHGTDYGLPQLTVSAFSESGTRLSSVTVNVNSAASPLLVDVDQPSRLAVPMRGWPILASWSPGSRGSGSASSALTVGAPSYDKITGDPILPDRAAGYAAVTVLLIHSDTLGSLEEGSLDALVGWVIAGGTLAIVPSRPEDLRAPLMTSLVGGVVTTKPPSGTFLKLPVFEKPTNAPSIGGTPSTDDDVEDPAPGAAPTEYVPTAAPKPRALRTGPSAAVREKLTGYAGGNLQASEFGASAPYGQGEVHLLGFDPTASPMLEDPWVHSRIVDMIARAWDRKATTAFVHGAGEPSGGQLDSVRRSLDPNENFRIGLGITGFLLVLYSLVVGPLTFARAAKRGKPLDPLLWAPVWSAVAFGAIVIVGLAGKGWRGRSRHLSLVEANAGFTRGTVRRFRGFFASEARSLSVAGSERGSVVQMASTDSTRFASGTLRVERNGMTLGGLTSLPWQTVVVREDSFVDLHGGITVWPSPDGTVSVVNRSGSALKDVLVLTPRGDLTYITTIADGEAAKSSSGQKLTGTWRTHATAGLMPVHVLNASAIQGMMGDRDGKRFAAAWDPLADAAGDTADFWPDNTAVVIGEMIGLPKASKDSGLAVESDRTMFRIVGFGGTP